MKKTIAHTVVPTGADFVANLSQFMCDNELPVGSSSQFAQWKIFQLAKQKGVTVLLDGQGSDELLGGYEQYFNYYLSDIFSWCRLAFFLTERKRIQRRYPQALFSYQQHLLKWIPKKILYLISQKFNRGSNFLFGLNSEFIELNEQLVFQHIEKFGKLKSVLYSDSFKNSLTTLLRYGDRNSMAHSREVRLPFCDHRIAEFVFSLSPTILMGQAQTKKLLRKSMTGLLPTAISRRWNKQGFLPPQAIWLQHELGQFTEQLFHSRSFAQRGFWNTAWWQKTLQRFQQGETHLAWVIWKAMIGESWITYFIEPMKKTTKQAIFLE